ncbi:Cadherin-like and PC-esterase domain-containing protein 1 [Clonorchis sinensis]|uniref:Cadherin-like and PC-esterase domain-containing protein 1 n=1 Tax=Clonorchis sinensis TaxID=79923 RepID=A0A8T1MCA6_CLOSI|nr:Cadherin-like and PC-esterase domain-containing protein 1 [Clonorchis sinensis]
MSSCLYDESFSASNHKDLRNFLQNKQLLFVGDSTLRDLMLALVEQVNGTLTFGSPTHGYLNITQPYVLRAGFAYFPDYGLSQDNQSTFMDHVDNLFRLYPNARYIILIFGGAQWLSKPMLRSLADFLQSWESLNGGSHPVRVIMKDESAGFHSPITGVPHIKWSKRQQLSHANSELISVARSYGWSVLRTHSLTWTRLNHFEAYARCSCHFHQIKPAMGTHNSAHNVTGPIMRIMLRMLELKLLYG